MAIASLTILAEHLTVSVNRDGKFCHTTSENKGSSPEPLKIAAVHRHHM